MPIIKKPIVDASDEEIRTFCELQQLDVADAKSRSSLLALLGPAWEHDFIPIQVAEARADDEDAAHAEQTGRVEVPAVTILGNSVSAGDPTVRLKIGIGTLAGGKDPVTVSVNGVTTLVARQTEVSMPYRYFLALQNAVRQDVDQDLTSGDISHSDITNYPMEILSRPTEAEIAAWHARTDHLEIGGAAPGKALEAAA